ncbi:Ulp1 family isopeptidase [Sansalvadorimonas verongulae]|uniref:Ulp1 family isopeptidase n=1 Tax=Sansalvadorimonas verongulae TaxID=2172824 RepID=UPI0018AD2A9E|nr:Ulp1 family isopeptidase [Sansalvadorimonas verongulae]
MQLVGYGLPMPPHIPQRPASPAEPQTGQKRITPPHGTPRPARQRIKVEEVNITATTPSLMVLNPAPESGSPIQIKLHETASTLSTSSSEVSITRTSPPVPSETTRPLAYEVYKIESDDDPEPTTRYIVPAVFHDNLRNAFTESVTESKKQSELISLSIPLPNGQHKTLSPKDLQTLDKEQWLNDEIINAAFALYDLRACTHLKSLRCRTFTSFHLPSLKMGAASKKKYGLTPHIGDFHRMIFPVHRVNHWLLVVVDIQRRTIFTIDSLDPGIVAPEASTIQTWLEAFYTEIGSHESAKSVKSFSLKALAIPSQVNDYDCGSAIIKAGRYFYEADGELPDDLSHPSYEEFRKIIKTTLRGCSHIEVIEL